MTKKTVLLALSSAILLCSCSNDDDNKPGFLTCEGQTINAATAHLISCSVCETNYCDLDGNMLNGCEGKFDANKNCVKDTGNNGENGGNNNENGGNNNENGNNNNNENGNNNNNGENNGDTCDAPKTKCDFGCVTLADLHMTDCNTCADGYINADTKWENGCESLASSSDQITLGSDFFDKSCELKDLGLPVDYILDEDLYINCALKIEPGVTIAAKSQGINILVREGGSINAVGTEDKPIVMTSGGTAPMGRLVFDDDANTGVTNTLTHVQFKNMGHGHDEAIAIHRGIKVAMDHVTVDTVNGNGIWMDENPVKFENVTIKNCSEYPLVLEDIGIANVLGENNVYENNTKNVIVLGTSGTRVENPTVTFQKQAVPYYFLSGLYLGKGKYTFPAGLEVRVQADSSFKIYYGGTVTIAGTAENPVVMTAMDDEGTWDGPRFEAKTTIEHLKLDKCKYAELSGAYEHVVDHLTMNSVENGLVIDTASTLTKLDNTTITSPENPLHLYFHHLSALGSSNTFKGDDDHNAIIIENGYVSVEKDATISKQNIPYMIDSELTLLSEGAVKTVNIEAGTHIVTSKFTVYEKIKLNVNGTATDHVVFEARKDEKWNGMLIDTPSDVKLSYLDIKDVDGGATALEITSASTKVTLDHVSLSNPEGACLVKNADVTGLDTVTYDCKTNIAED